VRCWSIRIKIRDNRASAQISEMRKKHTHAYTEYHISNFKARSQDCEKRLLAPSCLPVCQSVRKEQLYSHCTDFHEI
jgi:hypothetical protein